MATISSAILLKEIKSVLKGADLTKLSSKAVRKTLENSLKTDLTDRKKEIDDMLLDMIDQNSNSDEDIDSGSSPEKRQIKKESKSGNSSSDDDSDGELLIDTEPVKKRSKPGKKIKAEEDTDEALAKRLQEEEESLLPRRSAFIKASSKKKAVTKVKRERTGPSNSTYSRPCSLSAELAEVVGAKEMPRYSVVKKMWEVARERELFDPTNKRYIICDDQLTKMFGTKRILMFGIMKYLKTHIKDQKDLAK